LHARRLVAVCVVGALASCAGHDTLRADAGYGADPTLPAPTTSLIPTIDVAEATGWPDGVTPTPAPGFAVRAFARGLAHPRWLYVLPNGDVLVAETNAPPRPQDDGGVKGWFMKLFMRKAGAGVASPDRITLLRDTNDDGVADVSTTMIEGLHSPFGMTLVGSDLYVADTDALLRFRYTPGATRIAEPGTRVVELPAGPINHHWTKNVVASPDGARLYVTVGSNSNVAENGIDQETGRAAILEVDRATGRSRVFASGLRNANGLDLQPDSGALWTAVNERDELGDDLVPDYMTAVRDGGFYGWPYSYYGAHVDTRVSPSRPDLVARAIAPDYALGAHTASLGLAFYRGTLFAPRYRGGAFIGQHGSWNRKPPSGYKVVFVPFAGGRPAGPVEDVLTGFRRDDTAYGRPVGVAVDARGALLVADDVGNVVWRVTPQPSSPPTAMK